MARKRRTLFFQQVAWQDDPLLAAGPEQGRQLPQCQPFAAVEELEDHGKIDASQNLDPLLIQK